jgi:hypothetical protein
LFTSDVILHFARPTKGTARRFADAAVEVCDGLPSYVEANLGTWAGANYCPWGARVVAEQK